MALIPSAVIFVNNDLTDNVQIHLVKQLHISEVISGTAFDERVLANPDYATQVNQSNQRLMVVRSFEDINNRDLADVLIFVKGGLAAVETDKTGPPGITVEILNITWGKIGIYL